MLAHAGNRDINSGMATVVENYRYLTRTPGIRGGNARVEGTRIGVHDVIGLLQNGETVDTITATCFLNLTKAQVYECLAYYEDHRDEINLLVAEQMTDSKA
jgi:uncharacterized protein (DUF433 family)